MTKDKISKITMKHIVRPILVTIVCIILFQQVDMYYFGGTPKAPFFAIIFSLIVIANIFKNVLTAIVTDESDIK